jgi:hypothetical protein
MTATTKPTVSQVLREAKRQRLAAEAEAKRQPTIVDRVLRRKPAPPPSRLRPVHWTARIPIFGAQRGSARAFEIGHPDMDTMHLTPTTLVTRPGRPYISGWQEAQQRLERATGAFIRLTPKGRAYLVSNKGRAPEGTIDAAQPVLPWIAAGLAGTPWSCDWCPKEATALLVGGAPVCEEHG